MTKYNPPPAFEQSLLIKRGKRAARERASEQHSRFRVSSRVPLARLLFTISPKWKACKRVFCIRSHVFPFVAVLNHLTKKTCDQGRAPSSRILIPLNILHLLTICFLPTILSFYSSSKWGAPDLYSSRPHIVRRS